MDRGVIQVLWRARMFRSLTWSCVVVLAVLSLLPGEEMVRTTLPAQLEHLAAFVGSGAIAYIGYGANLGVLRIVGSFSGYGALLEWLQQFSPGRRADLEDVAIAGFGALLGCLGIVLLRAWFPRLLPR